MQIQPVDLKLLKDTKPNENGLNFCKHHIHWDLMTIYIMKVIFLKCQISMSSLCKNFANVQLDHMELRKMEIVNAEVVFKS